MNTTFVRMDAVHYLDMLAITTMESICTHVMIIPAFLRTIYVMVKVSALMGRMNIIVTQYVLFTDQCLTLSPPCASLLVIPLTAPVLLSTSSVSHLAAFPAQRCAIVLMIVVTRLTKTRIFVQSSCVIYLQLSLIIPIRI